MIRPWPPLAPPGQQALAALCALHGRPPALAELQPAAAPADPVVALSQALATRQSPPALGRASAPGRTPAARLLRRMGRRARFGLVGPPSPADPDALMAALAQRQGQAEGRVLVANAPAAAAHAALEPK